MHMGKPGGYNYVVYVGNANVGQRLMRGNFKMAARLLGSLLWVTGAVFLSIHVGAEGSSLLSASQTLLFGPGLHRDSTSLPLNYFFIQARDSDGVK